MTLIEVLAGLAILGTLLVALLVARDRYVRQWSRATARVEAAAVADALLAAWWAEPRAFPRRGEGVVEGQGRWRWRTAVVPEGTARDLGVEVVRLEVFDARDPAAAPVALDVVLPPALRQGGGS